MQFSVVTELSYPSSTVWKTVTSQDFIQQANEYSGVTATIISEVQGTGKRTVVSKVDYVEPLPKPAAKALGKPNLSYTMEQVFHDERMKIDWTIQLPELGKKFSATGSMHILDKDKNSLSHRVDSGTIQVKIPFFGSKIEREIIKKLELSYNKVGQFTKEYLQKQN